MNILFCIDFSELNAISTFDPYPVPQVDELVKRLGKDTYLSTHLNCARDAGKCPWLERHKS